MYISFYYTIDEINRGELLRHSHYSGAKFPRGYYSGVRNSAISKCQLIISSADSWSGMSVREFARLDGTVG